MVECWNRTMKMGIQALMASGKAWEEGLQELLAQHQALPATSEGCSLAELLMGRHMCLPFEVATSGLVSLEGGGTQKAHAPTSPRLDEDWRRDKLHPTYWVSDQVLAKGLYCLKGKSPFAGPLMVTEVISRYSF